MAGPTFEQSFTNYGEGKNDFRKEVKEDLKRAILTEIGSTPFSRSTGLGLESFENDPISEDFIPLLKFAVATAIAEYNQATIPERRVLASQDSITVDNSNPGILKINIYYVLQFELAQGTPALESGDVLTLPEET